jgi:mRNA interferase MazF
MNENHQERCPKIGDVYLMHFCGQGNEQKGWRPGLIFQNNLGNLHSPNVIALPLTTSLKKAEQPTHVVIPANGTGLLRDSMVLCENPERMSKDKLGAYLTTIPEEYMAKIAVANLLATSAISFIEPDMLLMAWQKALSLNTASV